MNPEDDNRRELLLLVQIQVTCWSYDENCKDWFKAQGKQNIERLRGAVEKTPKGGGGVSHNPNFPYQKILRIFGKREGEGSHPIQKGFIM